jgi:hypothetical protein
VLDSFRVRLLPRIVAASPPQRDTKKRRAGLPVALRFFSIRVLFQITSPATSTIGLALANIADAASDEYAKQNFLIRSEHSVILVLLHARGRWLGARSPQNSSTTRGQFA